MAYRRGFTLLWLAAILCMVQGLHDGGKPWCSSTADSSAKLFAIDRKHFILARYTRSAAARLRATFTFILPLFCRHTCEPARSDRTRTDVPRILWCEDAQPQRRVAERRKCEESKQFLPHVRVQCKYALFAGNAHAHVCRASRVNNSVAIFSAGHERHPD